MLNTKSNVNVTLILAPIGVVTIALTLLSITAQHALSTQASNMTSYSDPNRRFSISYPSNWTATPAADRFETVLVTFSSGAGAGADVELNPTQETDPQADSIGFLDFAPSFGFTLFQNVECVKYKVDGQKACSTIFTKQGNPDLGIPNGVAMTVLSYVNGRMYTFNYAASATKFDSMLPTFEAILHSFKAG